MKNIEYTCDVCGDMIHKERLGENLRPFVSFEFNIESNTAPPRQRFRTKPPQDVERHICNLCLAGLVALADANLPAEMMRAATWTTAPAESDHAQEVAAAKAAGVCRICGKPISVPYTLDRGKEFAHTVCLETTKDPADREASP